MIYLASPYSHPEPKVRHDRYLEAVRAAAHLTARGLVVFSPVVNSHPMHVFAGLNGRWEFWKPIDFAFIDLSSKLVVLTLPGWRESVGVRDEMEHARQRGIPVAYMPPDGELLESVG